MNLTLAKKFQQARLKLVKAVTDYKTEVLTVNKYAVTVASQSVPVLNYPDPTFLESFATTQADSKLKALKFTNILLVQLEEMPDQISNYDSSFSSIVKVSFEDLIMLSEDPTSSAALNDLISNLTVLTNKLKELSTSVNTLYTSLETYKDDLPNQALILSQLVGKCMQEGQYDQDQLATLNADIATLNSQISTLEAAIIGTSVGDGLTFIFGGILIPIFGFLLWGAGLAVMSTFIALDESQLQAAYSTLNSDIGKTDLYTKDAFALTTISGTYQNLANQAANLQQHVQNIIDAWDIIIAALSDTVDEISKTQPDVTKKDWDSVAQELCNAQDEWNHLIGDLSPIAAQIKGSNASISIGMSSSEIQQAVAASTVDDFGDYITSLS